jgi:hypothetical protein
MPRRRTLSMKGRVLAAGLSVAVGGALVGLMAADDHTADASHTDTPAAATTADGSSAGATATPSDGRDLPTGGSGTSGFSPQPQTRTGGS